MPAVVASSSSAGNGYAAFRLVDATRWPWITALSSTMGSKGAIIDLRATRTISAIELMPADRQDPTFGPDAVFLDAFPRNFRIDLSMDRATWTPVIDEINFTPTPNDWNRFSFASQQARFARLNIRETRRLPSGSFVAVVREIHFIEENPIEIPPVTLKLNPIFHTEAGRQTAVITRESAEPGELTQSLCSPWQQDYRECACYYWAASRPDYVDVDENGATSTGFNWLDRNLVTGNDKRYISDTMDPRLLTYNELFLEWEQKLQFIVQRRLERNQTGEA